MVNKKIIGIFAIIAGLLMLSGCSNEDGTGGFAGRYENTFYVDTVDGRSIPCVYVKQGYGAGLSCDWS
jgi:uncharacterized lipoprotein NlpE involved in copper resistance